MKKNGSASSPVESHLWWVCSAKFNWAGKPENDNSCLQYDSSWRKTTSPKIAHSSQFIKKPEISLQEKSGFSFSLNKIQSVRPSFLNIAFKYSFKSLISFCAISYACSNSIFPYSCTMRFLNPTAFTIFWVKSLSR